MKHSIKVALPLLILSSLAIGIWVGSSWFALSHPMQHNTPPPPAASGKRLNEILSYIDLYYVDSVDADSLTEAAIELIVNQLDPHTAYIPARELELVEAGLNADFEGVGIEFNLIRDTIYVVSPVEGGPSERVGIQAGDQIVVVEGDTIAGKGISNREVIETLRGKKGSKVTVGVRRKGEPELLSFTITRDKIPNHAISAAFMADDSTGYIKLTRFSDNSYEEFREALEQLIPNKPKQLVLDLRSNPGGYMGQAVSIIDELLADDALIVYTEGKIDRNNAKEYAKKEGLFEDGKVIVLIDEGSASASEIVAGALQDNDRALIVGRRSFGKGLVQRPIPLSDGSQLRLTVSRYYTPSGRSIQKPYDTDYDYANEVYERYENGEFFALDSSKLDREHRYKTTGGRTVLGGGGIVPDVFIPADTSDYSPLVGSLVQKNIIQEFAAQYVQQEGATLQEQDFKDFQASFELSGDLEEQFWDFAKSHGVTKSSADYKRSAVRIKNSVKAAIARIVWKNNGYYPIILENDPTFQEALKHFKDRTLEVLKK